MLNKLGRVPQCLKDYWLGEREVEEKTEDGFFRFETITKDPSKLPYFFNDPNLLTLTQMNIFTRAMLFMKGPEDYPQVVSSEIEPILEMLDIVHRAKQTAESNKKLTQRALANIQS